MQKLSLVQAQRPPKHKNPSKVSFVVQESILIVNFEVIAEKIYAKNPLPPGEFPYQYDVVEVFFAVNGSKDNFPYYEFEVSPYNENFQVLVELKNGVKQFTYSLDLGLKTSANLTATGWSAEMRIPLKNLPWTGRKEDLIGNAFTILGEGEERSYWSLSLPPQEVANFHHPEFFKRLL